MCFRHKARQHFSKREQTGPETVRFRFSLGDKRERNHPLSGVEVLQGSRDHSGHPLRFRHRHVVGRLHHLRALHRQDHVLGQVQQPDAEVLHGHKREVPQQGDKEGGVQGAALRRQLQLSLPRD